MRSRRFSFFAGWAAVALLAVAGFAAFGDPNPTAQEIQVEAQAASLGHTSGAYAGLAFALLGGQTSPDDAPPDVDTDSVGSDTDLETLPGQVGDTEQEVSADEDTAGTIASPTSGWLSEVEVRALVSLYFQPEDVNRAVRVAWCESRFDPDSVNLRTGATGLFQHLPKYWEERASSAGFPGYDPANPEASTAAAAWAVYEGGGWDIFGCRG
jgi:hypothetical protein